jgi:L-alanine-DL-glutamate epimerase-like enolase superfamily enzyme
MTLLQEFPDSQLPLKIFIGVERLQLTQPLVHFSADEDFLEMVVFKVELSNGIKGWSEVRGNGQYATNVCTEDIFKDLEVLREFTPSAWKTPSSVISDLREINLLLAMGLDIALLDAQSKCLGVPLWRYIRSIKGVESAVIPPPPATHLQCNFGSTEDAIKETERAISEGFQRIKVRVGGNLDHDLNRINAIRNAADKAGIYDFKIVADANGGWTPRVAIEASVWLQKLKVSWLEQPITAGSISDMSMVRANSSIPIWADESVQCLQDLKELASANAIDGVHLKLEKAGSVDELDTMIEFAKSSKLNFALGQMDCGRLGCAVTTNLALGLNIEIAELWGCANVDEDTSDGLEVMDGKVRLSGLSGLGMHINSDVEHRMSAMTLA